MGRLRNTGSDVSGESRLNSMVIPRTYGRMGNYLFQVAATIGYAHRHGLEFSVPSTTSDPVNNPIYLQHLVNPKYKSQLPEVRVIERGHAYQTIPFQERWRIRNIVLDGYWQSEKYFSDCRRKVLLAFAFPWCQIPGTVSVHVRRGDYLRLAHKHPPVPKEWYDNAMSLFPGYTFLFFSDDMDWCRKTWGSSSKCHFSDEKDVVRDLVKISWCEHHISSASTFSWWGAWLNQNPIKRVIIPKRWFSEREEKKCDTKDIVPETWERI